MSASKRKSGPRRARSSNDRLMNPRPGAGSGRADMDGALAADRPGEPWAGLAVIGMAAEILDDFAAGLAVEKVTRRGCLGHFLETVRAVRLHRCRSRKRC